MLQPPLLFIFRYITYLLCHIKILKEKRIGTATINIGANVALKSKKEAMKMTSNLLA